MWILVLKGLKQAIEAHTARAYLHLSTINCQEQLCFFFKLATYHWEQCCGGLVSHPGRGGGVALGIVTIPAQLPPPHPSQDGILVHHSIAPNGM